MSDKLILELYERVVTLEDKVAILENAMSEKQSANTVCGRDEDVVEIKGKYRLLSDYLVSTGKNEITLTFSEIEEILHEKLPPSARLHRANWSNTQTLALAKSWYNVGYRTVEVDMTNEIIKFERANSAKEGSLTMSKYEPLGKYLEQSGERQLSLSFFEIENILGFELIDSLRKHPMAWYGAAEKSPTHVWKKVWCAYGYEVKTVDLDVGQVVFHKVTLSSASVTLSQYEEEIKDVLVAMLNKVPGFIAPNSKGNVYYSDLVDFVNAKYGRKHMCYGKPIGDMLGKISERCQELGYPLISAIVVNKNDDGNDRYRDFPTINGFCGIPTIAAKMKALDIAQKFQFIIDEMEKVKRQTSWVGL